LNVELIVAGSGAAYPLVAGTASSAYIVRHSGSSICLDLGQGSFANVAGDAGLDGLEAVFISHLHADHFVDLVPLRHYLRYEGTPGRRLRVVAPAGLADRLDGLTGEHAFAAATLDVEERREGVHAIGAFDVESRRVVHTADSYATRVSLRGSAATGLVFSGDCGRAADLAPLIRPGDTLLSEVAWGPGPVSAPGMHLDATSIGELAAATGPALVLLTHLQPHRDPIATVALVRERFGGEVLLVADGDRFTL